MSRRHRKKKGSSSVELNLAAMLDMAFQMLAFFVLTFKPAPVEGQLSMHLPPPVAVTQMDSKPDPSAGGGDGPEQSDENTLNLFVTANDRGDADVVKMGARPISKGALNKVLLQRINEELKVVFNGAQLPFDRIQLSVDPRLRYDELMKLVDLCTKQKLPDGKLLQRISFIEMPEGAAP